MFSLFNISSIFPGVSADPICPYVRTPMATGRPSVKRDTTQAVVVTEPGKDALLVLSAAADARCTMDSWVGGVAQWSAEFVA